MRLQPEIFASDRARELFGYWLSTAPAGEAPARADFDPAAIPQLIPEVVMVRPTPDGDFRISLFGTALRESFGEELTGESVFKRLGKTEAARLRRIQEGALTGLYGFVTLRQFYRDNGRKWSVQGLALPLKGGNGAVTRILSAFYPLTPAEYDRRRQEGDTIDRTTLQGVWRYDIARGTFEAVDPD